MTITLWIIAIVLVLVVLMFLGSQMNSRIAAELKANPEGERAKQVMLITFSDGREIPVNYLREERTVFAGSDFGWWKKIADSGTAVELFIQGEKLNSMAKVSQNSEYTYEVFERLRPDAPTWASRLVDAKLVIFDLE